MTVIIANIYPEPEHLDETISTLKFASRMMKVSNDPHVNLQNDPAFRYYQFANEGTLDVLLKKMEKETRELKQELAMHDTLANKGKV